MLVAIIHFNWIFSTMKQFCWLPLVNLDALAGLSLLVFRSLRDWSTDTSPPIYLRTHTSNIKCYWCDSYTLDFFTGSLNRPNRNVFPSYLCKAINGLYKTLSILDNPTIHSSAVRSECSRCSLLRVDGVEQNESLDFSQYAVEGFGIYNRSMSLTNWGQPSYQVKRYVTV